MFKNYVVNSPVQSGSANDSSNINDSAKWSKFDCVRMDGTGRGKASIEVIGWYVKAFSILKNETIRLSEPINARQFNETTIGRHIFSKLVA
jgi:hypothetical protein